MTYSCFSAKTIVQFETAATKAARSILFPLAGANSEKTDAAEKAVLNVQVTVKTGLNMLQFRDLTVRRNFVPFVGSQVHRFH